MRYPESEFLQTGDDCFQHPNTFHMLWVAVRCPRLQQVENDH